MVRCYRKSFVLLIITLYHGLVPSFFFPALDVNVPGALQLFCDTEEKTEISREAITSVSISISLMLLIIWKKIFV